MQVLRRIAHVAIVLAMPVAVILAPMYLFITPEYVRHEYSRPSFPPSFRFSPEERLAISDAILFYVRGASSREELEAVGTSDGEPALQEREIDHLADVRAVMGGLFIANGVALGVVAAAAAYLVPRRRRATLARGLRGGVYLTAGVLVVIVGASFLDFGVFFTAFHNVFFAEGTWLFDFGDTLIQLYPLPFWVNAVWKMGAVIAAELVAVYALAALAERSLYAGPPGREGARR